MNGKHSSQHCVYTDGSEDASIVGSRRTVLRKKFISNSSICTAELYAIKEKMS